MTIFKYEKGNKEIEISFTFQIDSWMGCLTPFYISWWKTQTNFSISLVILFFSLDFEYWNFEEDKNDNNN